MTLKRMTRFAVIFVSLFPLHAAAVTWYVHSDSSLNSIQAGLDSCASGDTVLVGPGTYCENIIWPYVTGLKLISESGPAATVIDGNASGSVIHLSLVQDDSLVLIQGFTIQNGDAWLGGGIHSIGGKPVISGNVIAGNTAQWPALVGGSLPEGPVPQGGGIYTEWSSPKIIDNVIAGNSALYNGGGVACYCDAANIAPWIYNNTITGNTAHTGGGVYISCPFTMTTLRDNSIAMNVADYGGGIACYYVINPLLKITNNMITMNIADSAGGGIWCYLSSLPIIDSCTISGNAGDGIYSGYFSSPLITNCNITDNAGFAVRNADPTELVVAENNWWGDATGPFHPASNPGGMGDTVSDYVDYDPWLTMPGIHELVPAQPVTIFLQASPNPFWKLTTVSFRIGQRAERIEIDIYDAAGRLVRNLYGPMPHALCSMQVSWDGTDAANRPLPGGVYFLRLTAGDLSATTKVVLSR
ncbi:right-handed parallel beta-helix repeat-containing protein [candidate division WOR-3 bacterium]|nr:right-handed parallel beta-helix repeat-containing protein [candidate division WOR-3 bacterium]